MTPVFHIEPDWKWGTPEGSREFDRLVDRSLSFREKLEWLEEMETLSLQMAAGREAAAADAEKTRVDLRRTARQNVAISSPASIFRKSDVEKF